MAQRAREDVSLRLEDAERRLKDARAEESRTASALETMLAEAARLRQAGAVPAPEDGAAILATGGHRQRRKGRSTGPRAARRRRERAANAMASSGNSCSGSGSSSDSSSEGGRSGGSSIGSGLTKHP